MMADPARSLDQAVVADPLEPGACASCGIYARIREFRDSCSPATLLGVDLLVIVGTWVCTGTAVFHFAEQKSLRSEFTGAYSFYYAMDIGLGVGNVPYQPTLGWVEVFECFYCCCGNCLVVGGLGVYFRILHERSEQHLVFGAGPSERPWLTKKFIFGFAYAVVVTYGCLVAYYAAGYTSAADLMLWSVTYLQTSGLLLGHYTFQNFLATGFFLLVGIPIAAIFMAELCDQYFDYHERVTIQRRASIIKVPLRGRTFSQDQPAVAKPLLPPKEEAEDARGPNTTVRSDVLGFLEDLAASLDLGLKPPSGDDDDFDGDDEEARKAKARPQPLAERRKRESAALEPFVDDSCCGLECDELFMPDGVKSRWHAWHVWRAGYDPLHVLAMDLVLSVGVWLAVGTMWFAFFQMDNGWSGAYSIYYAVNVGMGVGSAQKQATGAVTKWFEVVFCVCGSVLIVGGIGLTFRISSDRAKRFVAGSDHPEAVSRFRVMGFSPVISFLGTLYVFVVGLGLLIAYYCCGFRRVDDLFLWTITNMTTAGLRVSQADSPHYHMYAFTAAFMLVGIPASAIFYAEIAAELFDYHEKAVVTHRLSMLTNAADWQNSGPPEGGASASVIEAGEVKQNDDDVSHTTVDRDYLNYLENIALSSGAVDKDTLDRKKAGGSPIAEPIDGVTMTSRSVANVFKAVPDSDSDDGER